MARPKENTERINIFLSPKDLEYLRKLAKQEGSSVSLIVRRAVKTFISRGGSKN
jgi:hypothetical protein